MFIPNLECIHQRTMILLAFRPCLKRRLWSHSQLLRIKRRAFIQKDAQCWRQPFHAVPIRWIDLLLCQSFFLFFFFTPPPSSKKILPNAAWTGLIIALCWQAWLRSSSQPAGRPVKAKSLLMSVSRCSALWLNSGGWIPLFIFAQVLKSMLTLCICTVLIQETGSRVFHHNINPPNPKWKASHHQLAPCWTLVWCVRACLRVLW